MCPIVETGIMVRSRIDSYWCEKSGLEEPGRGDSEWGAPPGKSLTGEGFRMMAFILDETDSVVSPQLVGKPLLLGASIQWSLC